MQAHSKPRETRVPAVCLLSYPFPSLSLCSVSSPLPALSSLCVHCHHCP